MHLIKLFIPLHHQTAIGLFAKLQIMKVLSKEQTLSKISELEKDLIWHTKEVEAGYTGIYHKKQKTRKTNLLEKLKKTLI